MKCYKPMLIAIIALILLAGNVAAATTITYILTGNLNGKIGSTTLNGAAFQFTVTADISGEVPAAVSNSIYIAGVGSGTFNPTMSFSYGGSQGTFVEDIGFPFTVVEFTSAGLAGWTGFSPIGPVSGTPSSPGSWTSVQTSLGTLTVAGMTNLSFRATSAAPAGPLTVATPATLPAGTNGVYYSRTLAASGGTPSYGWTLTSGALPAGLSLSRTGGITGTPTSLGTQNFTVTVTDTALLTATQNFSLTIGATQSFANALRIPQIVDGGGWKTRFAIVNTDQVPVTFTFQFWNGDGTPLAFPILNGTAGVLSATLAPGASFFAESPATSPTLLQGWAEVASGGRIGLTSIYQFSVGGSRDSVGTEVATVSGNSILMPFDNTNLNVTSIAIANTNPTQPLMVSMLIQTDTGMQSAGSLLLRPHSQKAFVSKDILPTAVNARGSIQFTAPTPDIAVIGVEFTPAGQFTSLGTFQ